MKLKERYCNSRERAAHSRNNDEELRAYEFLQRMDLPPVLLIVKRGYWLPLPAYENQN
jgi:hypothetical protein